MGNKSRISNLGSTITTGYGVKSEISNSSGSITNARGVDVEISGSGITNGYGIYVNDVSATNAYGIYQLGADDDNYFAGDVGIGTTTPRNTLHVNGRSRIIGDGDAGSASLSGLLDLAIDDTDTGLEVPSDGVLALYTQNAERVRVDGTGNVGIGTTTTPGKLNVAGDIRMLGSTSGYAGFKRQIQRVTMCGPSPQGMEHQDRCFQPMVRGVFHGPQEAVETFLPMDQWLCLVT
jgi:hypothetical protein